jgi:putative sigma-54 modulation protein
MQVTFSNKSSRLGESEREYASRKLQRLARFFKTAREAHVTHSELRGFHIVEVQLDLDGTLLRAEERRGDFNSTVDAVTEKLEHQVRRLKEKVRRHKGRADAPTVALVLTDLPEEAGPPPEPLPAIARRKRFLLKPMSEEEAALQMELLNHDFYAFLNSETEQINVLYRRRDGQHGLLELEA